MDRVAGLLCDGKSNTVGSVNSLSDSELTSLPLLEARVVVAFEEGAAVQKRDLAGCLANDGDFVAILEVRADTWEILDNIDAKLLELSLRTNTGELHDLRGVESTSGQNDLTSGLDGTLCSLARSRSGLTPWVSAIERLSCQEADASSLGLRTRLVKVDVGDEGVELDVEMVLSASITVLGIHDLVKEVDRASTLVLWNLHGERNLPHALGRITVGTRVVDVAKENLAEVRSVSEVSSQPENPCPTTLLGR